MVVALVVLGGVGVGTYFLLRKKSVETVPDHVGLGPVKPALLIKIAKRKGVALPVVYFAPDEAIRKAARVYGRGAGAKAVASGLLKVLRAGLAVKGTGKTADGKKPWLTLRPAGRQKRGELIPAPKLWEALAQKRPVTVVSYELACLYLALAREAGLKAVLAEIYRHTDLKGPADPSGYIGHFGVAIYGSSKYTGRPVLVVDPARGTLNNAKEFEVLTDLRAAAHGLAQHAEVLLKWRGDPANGMEASQNAVKLAPRSATILASRGMLLMKAGGLEPGLDALRSARSIREDAPRYLLVGVGNALKKDLNRAMTNIDQAIGRDPDFAQAYLWKAQFLLARGKTEEAVTQLDKAQELDADLPEALVLRATLLTMQSKPTQAMALLRRALKLDPASDDARFALFRLLYLTGEEDDAAAEAKKWLAMVPQTQRAQLRELIDGFKKTVAAQKARMPVAPPGGGMPGAGVPGGGDPYKLKTPMAPGGGFPGGSSPFGKPSGSDPMLHL